MGTSVSDSDNENSADRTLKAFANLADLMPAIGFFSQDKRISAYITITDRAQRFLKNETLTEEEVMFVLSLLVRKNKNFQKASMATALSLHKLDFSYFSPIGISFANEVRKNTNFAPVDRKK